MDDEYFMEFALEQAKHALNQNEFPVGCVIVYKGEVIASGARTGTRTSIPNEIDHAEIIALRRLTELENNIDRSRTAIYCTMEPCLMCFGAVLLSGIGKIVYAYEDVMGGGTRCDLTELSPLYTNHPIQIVPGVLRLKSIALFRQFFENPKNSYWRGSLLAEYTLTQTCLQK